MINVTRAHLLCLWLSMSMSFICLNYPCPQLNRGINVQAPAPFQLTPYEIEIELGDTYARWWRAQDLSILGDGAAVATWNDYIFEHSFLQAAAGLKPVIKTSVAEFNNLPAVRFDGVDDYMACDSDPIWQAENITIFAVARPRSL